MDLTLGRPLALLLLLVPAALVLLARAPRPDVRWSAALAFWPARDRPAPARRRPRRPPALWLAAAALAAAALALADPRAVGSGERVWTFVLDDSPSMSLVERGRTRADRALAGAGDLVGREAHELRTVSHEAEWAAWDRPGCVWLTDREPAVPRRHAGLVAVGGSAAPGAVAAVHDASGWSRLVWNGTGLAEERCEGPDGVWIGPRVPEDLRVLTELWAAARGFALCAREGARVLCVAVADGGPVPSGGAEARVEPGRLSVPPPPRAAGPGDPAERAVAWAALCDRAARGPDGVVPLRERLDAGEPLVEAGRPPEEGEGRERPLAPALALAAALLALGALAPWRGGRQAAGSAAPSSASALSRSGSP